MSVLFWKFNILYVFGSCFFCVVFYFVSRLFAKLKYLVMENAPNKRLRWAEEEPMSNNNAPQIKYDVFVSFRGSDVRRGLLSHLTDAFKENHINAFVDDNLEKGENIWPSLVGAIKGSSMSLIVFSSNYASSHWCLEELVEILECRKNYEQIVIPIFYNVEPRDVGHQSSESYKNAFADHERIYETTKVQKWKESLKESAKLSGIVSSIYPTDAQLVKEIMGYVKDGLKRLTKQLVNLKRLVGIDEKVAMIESWISEEPNDTRLIGIWGMGGLGKTTLAEQVFNKIRSKYGGSYFLADERDRSSKRSIISLKKEIFSELLGYDVKIQTPYSLPKDVVRNIGRKRFLIVLDDVNDSTHIEKLLGALDNFGSGSKIIVTTRDEGVLKANKVDKTYPIEILSSNQVLELFNLNAFKQNDHQRYYNELSVVNYAKGIPLIVKVLAGLLCERTKEVWEAVLQKKAPNEGVYNVMKLSYDYLPSEEKDIFLDLACFIFRLYTNVKVGILKSLLTDERHNSVVWLESLKEKALINFSEDDFVSMHDCLQEMGWKIVRDSESRKWLWDPDDICKALENDKGNKTIRSLQIDFTRFKEQELSPEMFTKMKGLQFLEISGDSNQHYILAPRLSLLVAEVKLRFLSWYSYPQKSLPEKFLADKLVILRLIGGKMENLWEGVKNLANLKQLNLSQSRMLKELPDLSKATNLEELVLWGCSELTSVHPSVFSLDKLKKLDLWNCDSLTVFKSDSHLRSLSYLNLGGCTKLWEFSLTSENMNMKYLTVGSTEFSVHSTFVRLKLDAIKSFTSSFNNFTQLLHLEVTHCQRLLKWQDLPPFLETLDIRDCEILHSLPELPPSLKILFVSFCNSLKSLPELPQSLETLDVSNCDSLASLPKLPPYLKILDVNSCQLLQSVPQLLTTLKTLSVKSCILLQSLPELPPSLEILVVHFSYSRLSLTPKLPPSLKTLNVRSSLKKSLPELPQFLETLDVSYCASYHSLPKLPPSLKTLIASFCKSLKSLPELPLSIETLDVQGCILLQTLPEFPVSLETMNATECKSLKTALLFPSTDVEQLKENRKWALFWNCLNLDEDSLLALELNAKINVMKFANNHLSTPNHDHVENYNDYDDKHKSYQAVYVYPGSSVAEWLEYKETKDVITVDLYSRPPSPKLGFIFCFVLGYKNRRIAFGELEVKLIISDDVRQGKKEDSVKMLIESPLDTIESDHLCVMYDQRCSDFLNSRVRNQTRFKIQVRTQAQLVLKGFGLSPMSTSTYSSFIRQME